MSMSNEPTGRAPQGTAKSTATASPVVIDLGKKSRKRIKNLRKGKPGQLMDKIQEAIDALKGQGAISESAQPVIVVVRERAKRPAWLGA